MRRLCCLFLCLFPLAATAAQSFTDADGVRLTLGAPAQRIISLAPHFTDMLQSMGAGRQIVAVIDDHDSRGRYMRSQSGYPLVGDAAALNYERMVALKPDVVIAWGSGTPRAWIAQMRQLGLPVLVLEARSLPEIGEQLGLFGRLAGHAEEAVPLQAAYEKQLATLRSLGEGPRLRYFYQIWAQPLYSLGRQHLLSQALALCGADNIVPPGPVTAPLVNPEFVLTANPEVILFGRAEAASARLYWGRFPSLQAVQKQHLLDVDDKQLTRPGPQMLEAVSALCGRISAWRREIP